MLPNSHHPQIIGSTEAAHLFGGFNLSAAQAAGVIESGPHLSSETSLPTSLSAMALAEAFANFVSTSSRLEHSYRELQSEVSGLRAELAERNSALKESLSENRRVRVALQQIVDSMPCGVLVATRGGKLTTVNPEASRLLALPAYAPLPMSLCELEETHGFQTQEGGDGEQEFCLQAGAEERWLHVLVRQLPGRETEPNEAGAAEHTAEIAAEIAAGLTILILRDVTAQKRAERDREAAHNATVLAQITSMLAHEIRNPLGSLELFAELIENDAAGRAEWIRNLRAGIRSLAVTVNNVLGLHDTGSLKRKRLRLAEAVGSTVRFAKPLVDQAMVSLRWLSDNSQEFVEANEGALHQVLLNLIRNAVRHTPAGGSITLSVETAPAHGIAVQCVDTGSGIGADAMGKLFQPGFSGSGDSPGLGLAVCERIMRQHGGEIHAANAPGAGACFTLVFPPLKEELTAA